MGNNIFDNSGIVPRKIMTLFYLVDSSGSMMGEKIGTVNAAMAEAITHDLPEISDGNDDAEINVAILEFNTNCRWKTPNGPEPVGKVSWNPISAESGNLTNMGKAFRELDTKLSQNKFLKSTTGAFAPVLLLLSDGEPTDSDWQSGLEVLQTNNWYKHAVKIAIAIGKDANRDVLAAFTKTPEAILTVADTDIEKLKKLILSVSRIASIFQTHTENAQRTDVTPEGKAEQIVKEVFTEVGPEDEPEDEPEDLVGPEDEPEDEPEDLVWP